MAPKIENRTETAELPQEELEVLLREVRAFLDDPIALMRRATELLRREDEASSA
jgi:hypothetical protein